MNKFDELLQPRKLEAWEKYEVETRMRLSKLNHEIDARVTKAHAGLKKRIDVEYSKNVVL